VRGWVLALLIAIAGQARAQIDIQFGLLRADSLLARGQLMAAESQYYAAVSARPRDPIARAALGRYLAARGALKVGVVLLAEARQFGGDPAVIARDLAPIYARLGDYASLARLLRSPLSPEERARVAMLVASGSTVRMDAASRVAWQPSDDAAPLGRVRLRISGRPVDAPVDPTGDEFLVAPSLAQTGLRPSGPSRDAVTMGVADSVGLGEMTWTNAPARIGSLPRGAASVGLGFLLRYAPTFDARERQLTLHSTGTVPRDLAATRYPALFVAAGPFALVGGRWIALSSPEFRALSAGKRFTIDFRRGEIEVGR
jgi:hypothetical protein